MASGALVPGARSTTSWYYMPCDRHVGPTECAEPRDLRSGTAYGFHSASSSVLAVGAHHPTGALNDILWDDPQFVYNSSVVEAGPPHSKQLQSSKVSRVKVQQFL